MLEHSVKFACAVLLAEGKSAQAVPAGHTLTEQSTPMNPGKHSQELSLQYPCPLQLLEQAAFCELS